MGMTKRKVCFSFCENRGQMNTVHCSCNCYVSMSFSRSLSQLALPYHLPRQSNKAQQWGWTLSRSFGLLRLAHAVGAAHLVVPKAGHPTMLGPTQQFWQHVVWLCVCVRGGVGPPLFQRQQLYQTLHTWRIYILLSPKMTWGSFLKELRFAIQG